MNESIALKHILEGLIHNLNNPLNLILGYAQRMKQLHPESAEADIIYKAGIQMDDALKDVTQKLWDNAFDIRQHLCLKQWLDKELKYLQHHLQIKHHVRFERVDTVDTAELVASELMLSQWYETVLGALIRDGESLCLATGVCLHGDKLALYFRLSDALQQLSDSAAIALALPAENGMQTVWDAENRTVFGVCG